MVVTNTELATEPENELDAAQCWQGIDWQKAEKQVRRLQNRIYCLTKQEKWYQVKKLQQLLARSYSNKIIAIKRVTQLNKGKQTPGVDGQVITTDSQRYWLSLENFNYRTFRPLPVRRIMIPKRKGGQRPLGIPTIRDRIMQAIVRTCLEPEWEARFEPNSFGFRPKYRTMDAVKQIWNTLHCPNSSEWILDADISGCFDNINHESILTRVPVFQGIIGKWLKAGAIHLNTAFKTEKGTPQGGIISPLLANIALDGMERLFGMLSRNGHYLPPSNRSGLNKGISLIRYADDFIVTAPTKECLINYVIPRLHQFLETRGLVLNSLKTRIVHRTTGFEFLGFWFKYFTPETRKPKLLVFPSKDNQKRLTQGIKQILRTSFHKPVEVLIQRLNYLLRGWTYYYRYVNAKEILNKISGQLFWKLWRWTKRQHPRKNSKWRKEKYFQMVDGRDWVFSGNGRSLFNPALVPLLKYVKIKRYSSIYDPQLRGYWATRDQLNHAFYTNPVL